MPRLPRFPCPRCQRSLECSGEVVVNGVALPVYQCDECISFKQIGKTQFEVAFTFMLDAAGQPRETDDPAFELPD